MTWSAPYPSKLFKYISENDAKYVAFSIRSDGDGSIAKHIVNMIICPIKALVDEHMQQAQNLDREYFHKVECSSSCLMYPLFRLSR